MCFTERLFYLKLRYLLELEDGQDLTEFVLLAALISTGAVVVLSQLAAPLIVLVNKVTSLIPSHSG